MIASLEESPQHRISALLGLTEAQVRVITTRAIARFRKLGQGAAGQSEPSKKPGANRAGPHDSAAADVDRLLPIVAHAVAVFGDEQRASHWFKTPLAILDDLSPAQILARGGGDRIDQILTRIEYNIPS